MSQVKPDRPFSAKISKQASTQFKFMTMKKIAAILSRLFDPPQWRGIETAPSDRELELAVIDGEVRPIGVYCLRHGDDWLDAETLRPIKVAATHWRFRWPVIFPVSCC